MPEIEYTQTETITQDDNVTESEVTETVDETVETETKPEAEVKTFTEEQVQKMIQQRIAREKKVQEEAVKEAAKLAKMTADQKRDYEFQKLKEENESFRAEQSRNALRAEARTQLTDKGLVVNDAVLELVTQGSTAEEVKEAIDNVSELINSMVTAQLQKELAGKTPKRAGSVVTGPSTALTKDEILAMTDPIARQQAIRDNFKLFED